MENETILLIASLAVLLAMSGYFSATETAFSSLNKIRIKSMASNGNKKAKLVLKLANNYDEILSTILIGNNIVNILSASLATILFVKYWGDLGITLSTIVMTILVLIFGEISPKSLAKENAESFAMFSAPLLKLFTWILTPLNFIFGLWKKLLAKMFKTDNKHQMTQDELLVLVDEVTQDGAIDADESRLLKSALEFTDRDAENILTPRIDIEALPKDASKEEIAEVFTESRYSRLLIYDETIDNVIGVLHQKDFYEEEGVTPKSLEEIMAKPIFVPRSIKISNLLKLLQKNKAHIAIVTDDYGGTLGIVTMEDILEELVGEIWDEHDDVVETFKKESDSVYKVACSNNLEEFFDYFNMSNEEATSETVGGWVMEQLGRIPKVGDTFTYNNLKVKVTSVDDKRLLEIEVDIIEQLETANV